jgi:FkbM family methyltransferase
MGSSASSRRLAEPSPPASSLARLWRLRGRVGIFVRQILRATHVAAGWRGNLRVFEIALTGQLSGRGRGPDASPRPIPMRELGGRALYVRPGTSDLITAVDDYLEGVHLPPSEVSFGDMKQIVELGSNNGSAMASLAVRYPKAQILGVEPDPRNVAVARRNVARFGGRCSVVQAGVWDEEVELIVEGDQAFGYTVRSSESEDPSRDTRVPAITIDALLDRYMPAGDIDYLYMTIEGTELRVLRAGGRWIERVQSIRLEWGIGGDSCRRELRDFGFDTWLDVEGAGKWTVGVRRGPPSPGVGVAASVPFVGC